MTLMEVECVCVCVSRVRGLPAWSWTSSLGKDICWKQEWNGGGACKNTFLTAEAL